MREGKGETRGRGDVSGGSYGVEERERRERWERAGGERDVREGEGRGEVREP